MPREEKEFTERRARRDSDSVYNGVERRSRPDDSVNTLTDDEMRYIRKMIEEDTRRKWLAKQTLSVATWIAAILIGITTVWDTLKNIIKAGGQ